MESSFQYVLTCSLNNNIQAYLASPMHPICTHNSNFRCRMYAHASSKSNAGVPTHKSTHDTHACNFVSTIIFSTSLLDTINYVLWYYLLEYMSV
jgi:hypothetical protein